MAQSGYTPIQLYYSTTAAATPTAGNLANGELALNIQDEKLYFKNASGTVKLLASSAAAGGVTSVSFGSTGLTPSSATSGAITVAGTLATTNGGTGLTSFTANGVMYASSTSALTTNSALTFDGTTLTTTGNAVISDNSANAALRITQTGAGNALVVEDSANPDSTPFVVDASGSVGVKTTSLTGSFNVVGNSYFGNFATAPTINTQRAEGSSAAPTVVSSGQTIGQLLFSGYDGTSYVNGAQILAAVDGTPGTNDMPGRLVFSTTADGASSPTEAMRINNAQQVSLGGAISGNGGKVTIRQLDTSASAKGFQVDLNIPSTATSDAAMFRSIPGTANAVFTLPALYHFAATQSTFGASSTVTNQFGFYAGSALTGATNNYGFYSNIASGTGRWNFYANGTADNYFAGNVGVGVAPVANNGILQLGSYGSVQALMEKATVSATAATGTVNFDAATQAVLYYTSNAAANWTINIRGSASLSLDSMMQTGQSLTMAFMVTQGATAYYQSALTVDGSSVTPKWQGGTAPTAGNASSIDAYVLTVIKTGSATFTVLASQTKFA